MSTQLYLYYVKYFIYYLNFTYSSKTKNTSLINNDV